MYVLCLQQAFNFLEIMKCEKGTLRLMAFHKAGIVFVVFFLQHEKQKKKKNIMILSANTIQGSHAILEDHAL